MQLCINNKCTFSHFLLIPREAWCKMIEHIYFQDSSYPDLFHVESTPQEGLPQNAFWNPITRKRPIMTNVGLQH